MFTYMASIITPQPNAREMNRTSKYNKEYKRIFDPPCVRRGRQTRQVVRLAQYVAGGRGRTRVRHLTEV